MGINDVHIVHLKSIQRSFNGLFDVFFVRCARGVERRVLSCPNFGGDHQFFPRLSDLTKSLSNQGLIVAKRI